MKVTLSTKDLASDSCLRRVHPFPFHPKYDGIDENTLHETISLDDWDGRGEMPPVTFWNCDPDYSERFKYYNSLISQLSQTSEMPEWYDEKKLPEWYENNRESFSAQEKVDIKASFSGGFVFDKLPKGAKPEWFDKDGKFNLTGLHCDNETDYDRWIDQEGFKTCPSCRKTGMQKLQLGISAPESSSQKLSLESSAQLSTSVIDVEPYQETVAVAENQLRHVSQSLLAVLIALFCTLSAMEKCGMQRVVPLGEKVSVAIQGLFKLGLGFQLLDSAKIAFRGETKKKPRHMAQLFLGGFFTLFCTLSVLEKCGIKQVTPLGGKVAVVTQALFKVGLVFHLLDTAKIARKIEKEVFVITMGLGALGAQLGLRNTAIVGATLSVTSLAIQRCRPEDETRPL